MRVNHRLPSISPACGDRLEPPAVAILPSRWPRVRRAIDWSLAAPVFVKILGIGVSTLLLFGLVTWFLTRSSVIGSLEAVLEQRSASAAAGLRLYLEQSMTASDHAGVDRELKRFGQTYDDLAYVVVHDAQGRIVAQVAQSPLPAEALQPAAFANRVHASVQRFASSQGMIFQAVEPILGGRAGWVQVGLSDRLLTQRTAELDRTVLLALAVSLSMATALAVLLSHLVTRPIQRLVEAARRIGEGHFDVPIPAVANDEIGHLTAAFADMVRRLADYHRQVEEKEHDRQQLLQRIVDAQEDERKHIARELHDQLGQSLMALLLWLQSECELHDLPANFWPMLEGKIRDLADDVHRLSWGMRPSLLDHYGLDSALSRYLEEIGRKTGLRIDYQSTVPDSAGRLPDRIEVTVYRIVQEAITNVLRHSRASQVSVVLLRNRDEVTVLVEDDGCGFDAGGLAATGTSRLGLTGIRERASLFGGDCTVESEPGRGTTIRVKIPWNEESCLSAP